LAPLPPTAPQALQAGECDGLLCEALLLKPFATAVKLVEKLGQLTGAAEEAHKTREIEQDA
jgi:hypothetical protein